MSQIIVEKNVAGIEGLCVITPKVHGDSRGYFYESYNANDMKENGIDIVFVQDNQSMSTKGGGAWSSFSKAISSSEACSCY